MSESEIFLSHNIRPTAVRQLVWREIQHIDYAFSLADVEDLLPTVDRSSIFRTLALLRSTTCCTGSRTAADTGSIVSVWITTNTVITIIAIMYMPSARCVTVLSA